MTTVAETEAKVTVACPACGAETSVRLPDGDAELVVRPYVAAWGDHETVTCSAGHRFWVYFC